MSNWGNIITVPENQINWATTTREPNQDLDRTAFLNLLITQLRHQDPLNPMDDRDFIAQMAQFSALEQMMNLNSTFERTQAFGMIGKVIDASFFCQTSEERIELEGALVTAVNRSGQSVYLVVQGEPDDNGNRRLIDVPFDAVTSVSEDFFLSHQLNEIFSQIQGQRAADLVGKYVVGFAVMGDDLEFVEGRVDSVSMQGNIAILHIGNRELLFPRDVVSASDERRLIVDYPEGASHRFTHGELVGIDVVRAPAGSRLYLIFDGGLDANDQPITRRIHAQHFNHVTSALTYVGEKITHGIVVDGIVQSITMTGGIPFLNVRVYNPDPNDTEMPYVMRQIDFLAYLAARGGSEVPNHSTTAPPATPPSTTPPSNGNDNNTDDGTDDTDNDDPDVDGDA
ncbi:MAG: hypothetical protein FWB96_02785 [Defluviitaleaceae bacterium]|nr:hypothetical protein [Defluviitaleaceae bacterium]MCL2261771.1 hypothetical protein [Defluviitaleaceae bacterium]